MTRIFAIFVLLVSSLMLSAKTTTTVGVGNWSNAGTWSNGVPVTGDIININHAVTFNVNFNLTGSGRITINTGGSLIDATGLPSYSLTMENSSSLILNGTLRIEGNFNMQSTSSLTVNSCDTLETGPTKIENNTTLTIKSCAVWLVNGNMQLENNTGITANGFIRVNGNIESKNNAEVTGSGNISSSGSVLINNASQIFGSTSNCGGPCIYGSGFPLPLKIISFNARQLFNKNVLVEWSVEDQENVLYYNVYRSKDGQKWEGLESVLPMNINAKEHYEIEDSIEENSLVYYKLSILEINGSEYNSDIIALKSKKELRKDAQITIYPNPASDYLFVKGEFSRLAIYDLSGIKVIDSKGFKIDISNLAKGVYTIKATCPDNGIQSSILLVK